MVQRVLPFYLKNVQKLQNSMLLYLNYTSFEIRDILKFAMALCDELIANFEGYLYHANCFLCKSNLKLSKLFSKREARALWLICSFCSAMYVLGIQTCKHEYNAIVMTSL